MSEIKTKYLYESVVQKEIESKKIEKKDNGQEISTPIKELKPVKIALLKPNRRLHDSSEIFYAKTMAAFLKEGLIPYSLVAKRYANDGGALSDPEKAIIVSLRKEIISAEGEYFELADTKSEEKNEDLEKKKRDLLLKINDLNQQINSIQSSYSDIYENTAEVKARNKLVEWWILNLAYIDEDDKGYKAFFSEGTLEDKLNKYDEFIDQDNLFYNDLLNRFSYLVSFWFSSRSILTKSDFENAEITYNERLRTYNPEATKEEIIPVVTEKSVTESAPTSS